MRNLNGRKFGGLKVLRDTGKSIKQYGCRSRGWECVCDCGASIIVSSKDLLKNRKKSCGCKKSKRKYRRMRRGYALIYIPDHPNADTWGYIPEHRFVVETAIGRSLTEKETVHHKNGIKSENQPENLELWTKKHPSGQRVTDMVAFCIDYLKEYKPEILAIN